jgi:hypothetical protein
MFEVDFPHGDTHWPHSMESFQRLAQAAELTDDEINGVLRDNAIRCYGLERFGLQTTASTATAAS